MGKKHKIKYRVIPDELVRDLVEFIDEMQMEAAKTNTTESRHLINLCNYLISCLINSDSFTDDFSIDTDEDDNTHDIPDSAINWDSTSTDFRSYDFDNISDEEYERMMNEADKLFRRYKKESSGKSKRINGNNKNSMTLEQFKKELKKDKDLSPEEKFELYYHERNKRKNKIISFDSMIKKLGLKKNKK